MELDELKSAWHSLDRRLSQQNDIQLALLRERKLERARGGLRPLIWGQLLQMLLGVGLIVLGVSCWTNNLHSVGLLISGVLVHAFGLLHVVMAGITLGLAGTIDYAAPVLRIQKQLARLLKVYVLNANLCGAPWWILWVLVVIAVAGLNPATAQTQTPPWIWISLALGTVGWLGTWAWLWLRRNKPTQVNADGAPCVGDGGDSIRRSQRVLDEIAAFEQE
ncbi:hypothetical protein [Pseudoxanthomonas indica]|uniref:Serine/threonine protein kinase n=1 Tax=Pseudoxanthomonas indica TaxID=428993 RepID=A0A1T5LNX2_9GAMM|nr:hypothetical protein [Pseudoxanthomonas indica]GGD37515.1 hypothetical protein GCM10007235_07130 [Pseudoxanthomonas indica]SKC77650.1 hypothetical protein SAMN06296058_2835 [Pseudoxanthomonas indica]